MNKYEKSYLSRLCLGDAGVYLKLGSKDNEGACAKSEIAVGKTKRRST